MFYRFLYDLAQIPEYADRVSCIMFHAAFTETISSIEHRLNNLKMTAEVSFTHCYTQANHLRDKKRN